MNNIVKQYGDGYLAVDDVSLEVADGELVILVGRRAAGSRPCST
jgi:multiple sugar transport system ATP-binding protein